MPQPLTIVLVEKTGELKELNVKDYKEDELFKKCGFKKADGFLKQTEWNVKLNGQKYSIMMFGKEDGKGLFNLTSDLWTKLYEKLFGGFEDLSATNDDDDEEDELDLVTKSKKTKGTGYLKDGFVVDDDFNESTEGSDEYNSSDEGSDDDVSFNNKNIKGIIKKDNTIETEDNLLLEDIGSELSEDSYEYN